MPSVLYNVEAYPVLKKEESKELEKIQHSILTQLLELPDSTPYVGILMETGMWKMEERVNYRKLMLYHRIVNSDDGRTIKKILEHQKRYDREGTWYHDVKRLCIMYGIKGDVSNTLKSQWKRRLKAKYKQ